MKTTLSAKDLAMYLGCECVITYVNPKWYGYINNLNRQVRLRPSILALAEDKIDGEKLAEVKPILRKLSSMTEEEAKEIWIKILDRDKLEKDESYVSFLHSDEESYGPEIWQMIGSVNVWQYLLSKSFDLFNYIEQGLALDVETIKKEK